MAKRKKAAETGEKAPVDRTKYLQGYYKEHRERLQAEKARKYREDPAYREAILKSVAESRKRQRELREARADEIAVERSAERQRRADVRADMAFIDGVKYRRKVKWQGEDVIVWPISAVATRVGRSIYTMRRWVRYGYIPMSPFRTSDGKTFYTMEQLAGIMAAYKEIVRVRTLIVRPRLGARLRNFILRSWAQDGYVSLEAASTAEENPA